MLCAGLTSRSLCRSRRSLALPEVHAADRALCHRLIVPARIGSRRSLEIRSWSFVQSFSRGGGGSLGRLRLWNCGFSVLHVISFRLTATTPYYIGACSMCYDGFLCRSTFRSVFRSIQPVRGDINNNLPTESPDPLFDDQLGSNRTPNRPTNPPWTHAGGSN